MKIVSLIGIIGENPNFIAFMAHSFFAAFIFSLFPSWTAVAVFYVIAAFKEFWYDIKYETNPSQTYADSALDFVGYLTGYGWHLLAVAFPLIRQHLSEGIL